MKSITLASIFKLTKRQKLFIILFGLLWLMVTLSIEYKRQFNQAEAEFQNQVQALVQQQKIEHKKADTILNALSEYYTSQVVKSPEEFRGFAEGLLQNSNNNYTIGLANLVARSKKAQIEEVQHQLGYESFNISNSNLFKQQQANKRHAFLAVTSITPLNPKNSVYLSEDLFSIPQLVNKFTLAIQTNETQSLALTTQKHGVAQRLIFKPIFLNSPNLLSHEGRLRQVRGVVFIIQPLEDILVKQAQDFFDKAHTSLTLTLFGNSADKFTKTLQTADHQHDYTSHSLFGLAFNSKFVLPSLAADNTLQVSQDWHLYNLQAIPLINMAFMTAVAYLLLTTLVLTLARYTHNLRQTQNRLSQILETSQDAVIITEEKGYIIDWNPEAEKLFGYSKDEAIGECIACLIFDLDKQLSPEIDAEEQELIGIFKSLLKLQEKAGYTQKTEVSLKNRSGDEIIAEVSTSVLHLKESIEISLFIKDISYQRRTEEAMTKMAYYDPLTQLENRAFFKQTIDEIIESTPDKNMAILFMDLDGFKQVNDTLGHSIGDELLIVIAKRIQNTLRSNKGNNHICRFGGDEFVIMLDNIEETGAAHVSIRLLNQIERMIKIETDELQVSASIGIALYPQHGTDVDTLLRHADTAMYESKELGKNTYSLYHDSMEEHLAERILIEKHLRNAIKNNEFSLAYQPQLNLQSGKIIGVEALIRWNNPVLGFVPPDKFISIAEESNLILNIGEWVTKTCIEQLQKWKNTRFDSLHIAMNVSSVQFEHPYFLNSVKKMMDNASIHNHLLEIELTERTVMNNVSENIERFNQIRSSGFGLSVDDFGTGYSSLSYLKKFPLSILKIDKSFVDGIPQEDEDISIATAILNLAHSLNMKVVAEGVETKEQLEFLKQLDCNIGQGYYISRPLPLAELEMWLINNQHNFFEAQEIEQQLSDHV